MNLRKILLPALLSFAPFLGFSQQNWCATDQYNAELLENLSEAERNHIINQRNKIFDKASVQQDKSGTVYTIPMVVHVIHDDCVGNISLEQIEDGIRVLNEDFRRLNSDTGNTRALFKPHAADVEIQFKLAKIDPNNKCTEGVVRVNSPATYDARNNVKSISPAWPTNKYLNVWLVQSIESFSGTGITLGYAQFPGGSWSTYGIVCRNDNWGTIGTSNRDGRTATHEVGHCLNLYHTFQSSCGTNCTNSGDRVCDTPPSAQATFGCNKSQNTCSNDANGGNSSNPNPYSSNVVDQIENYMSYDDCTNMFSLGQKSVMRNALNTYSNLINLVSSANLVATGTDAGYTPQDCEPIADFCQPKVNLCEGNTVTYTDRSYNGSIGSRSWSFPGGSPASSSDSIVTVNYSNAGTYNVSLTVSNAQGNGTKTSNSLINVLSSTADFSSWKYEETFESTADFNDNWTIENIGGGRTWQINTSAAYTGNNSVYIRNYINSVEGMSDELISPSYDLDAVNQPKLTFKVAYARKSQSSNDLLRLHYSRNCGQTWSVFNLRNSQALESVPNFVSGEFTPQDQSEWQEIDVSLPSSVQRSSNVRFKFEFVSGLGNNIYIDDINIVSLTGIGESALASSLAVYPNPVSDVLNIEFDPTISISAVALRDLSGRVIREERYNSTGNSSNVLRYDVSDIINGVYFLQLTTAEGEQVTRKIVIR